MPPGSRRSGSHSPEPRRSGGCTSTTWPRSRSGGSSWRRHGRCSRATATRTSTSCWSPASSWGRSATSSSSPIRRTCCPPWRSPSLVAGPAIYLLGHVLFRLRMAGTLSWKRLAGALACVAVGGLGAVAPGLVLSAARRRARRRDRRPSGWPRRDDARGASRRRENGWNPVSGAASLPAKEGSLKLVPLVLAVAASAVLATTGISAPRDTTFPGGRTSPSSAASAIATTTTRSCIRDRPDARTTTRTSATRPCTRSRRPPPCGAARRRASCPATLRRTGSRRSTSAPSRSSRWRGSSTTSSTRTNAWSRCQTA